MKTKTEKVNFQDFEYEYILAQAKELGFSVSEYIRSLVYRDMRGLEQC